jgi:hypothetical protein
MLGEPSFFFPSRDNYLKKCHLHYRVMLITRVLHPRSYPISGIMAGRIYIEIARLHYSTVRYCINLFKKRKGRDRVDYSA